MTDLQNHPQVKQTLTQIDEKYWYPFAYKVEHHSCTCHACGRTEQSTLTYKVFAHYLYTEHTTAQKIVPIGAISIDPILPIHLVEVNSAQPICIHCVSPNMEFKSDEDWRAFLRSEGARRSSEARRSNELRDIFGGPSAKPKVTPDKPKVSLADFLKDM